MLIAVVGMQSEVEAIGALPGVVVIQGRDGDAFIEGDLEAAIARGGVEGIISLGVAGGLATDLKAGAILIANYVRCGAEVVAADSGWRDALFNALWDPGFAKPYRTGVFAYSPGVVATAAEKRALRTASGGDAVDMETWKAAVVAARHGLPFAALRTISDPATLDDAPAAEVAMTPGGAVDVAAVVGSLAADPGQIGGLATLGLDAEIAFDNLAAAVLQLGLGLAFPRRASRLASLAPQHEGRWLDGRAGACRP